MINSLKELGLVAFDKWGNFLYRIIEGHKYGEEPNIEIDNVYRYKFIPVEGFVSKEVTKENVKYRYIEGDKEGIKACVGYDMEGNEVWFDMLNSHVLIGGASRWGKSSFLNVFITSVMLNYTCNEVKFLGCDYKMSDIYYYRKFKHFENGMVSTNKKEFLAQIKAIEKEITLRSKILEESNCRNVIKYNKVSKNKLSYIIFVIDEVPQLVRDNECREVLHSMMQKSASYGIYFMLATQDCTKDTIGKCKMNCSQTVAFHTRDETDSNTLAGKGYNLQDINMKGRCLLDNGEHGFIETQIFKLDEEEIEERLKHLIIKEGEENGICV